MSYLVSSTFSILPGPCLETSWTSSSTWHSPCPPICSSSCVNYNSEISSLSLSCSLLPPHSPVSTLMMIAIIYWACGVGYSATHFACLMQFLRPSAVTGCFWHLWCTSSPPSCLTVESGGGSDLFVGINHLTSGWRHLISSMHAVHFSLSASGLWLLQI